MAQTYGDVDGSVPTQSGNEAMTAQRLAAMIQDLAAFGPRPMGNMDWKDSGGGSYLDYFVP